MNDRERAAKHAAYLAAAEDEYRRLYETLPSGVFLALVKLIKERDARIFSGSLQ